MALGNPLLRCRGARQSRQQDASCGQAPASGAALVGVGRCEAGGGLLGRTWGSCRGEEGCDVVQDGAMKLEEMGGVGRETTSVGSAGKGAPVGASEGAGGVGGDGPEHGRGCGVGGSDGRESVTTRMPSKPVVTPPEVLAIASPIAMPAPDRDLSSGDPVATPTPSRGPGDGASGLGEVPIPEPEVSPYPTPLSLSMGGRGHGMEASTPAATLAPPAAIDTRGSSLRSVTAAAAARKSHCVTIAYLLTRPTAPFSTPAVSHPPRRPAPLPHLPSPGLPAGAKAVERPRPLNRGRPSYHCPSS